MVANSHLLLYSVCCPYPFLAIPGFLSFCAMVLTWVAGFDCHFFDIPYYSSTSYGGGSQSVGLWTVEAVSSYSGNGYCYGWNQDSLYDQPLSSDDLDGAMKAARAFGLMSSILGTVAFILIMIPACVSFGNHDAYLISLTVVLVVLGVFTILDLVSVYIQVVSIFSFSSLKATCSCLLRLCWLLISAKVRTVVRSSGEVLWQ